MTADLLPCPFCGGSAERIDFGPGSGDNEGGSCIACTKCQSSGPVEFGYKENFVSNWNRRALSHAAGQEAEPTERMVDAFHAGAGLGGYCAWVVNGLRSAMHCDPRITPAQATTNPAEIGRKSVGGEAVMEIITKNGFKHLRLPDDKSLTSLLDFPEGTKFYARPAQPPASAEVESKYHELIYAVEQKWPGETRHQTALRYIMERESIVTSEAASSGRKGETT